MAPDPRSSPPAPAASSSRRRLAARLGVGVAVAAVAAWGLVLAWGNGESGRAFIRARAEGALRARLGPVEVGDAGLDPLLRARLESVTVPGARPGAAPILRAGSVRVRPRLLPLLAGRIEPATVVLRSVRVAPGVEGEDLRRLLGRRPAGRGSDSASDGGAGALPVVHLHELWVDLVGAGGRPPVEVGPFDLDLRPRRDPGGLAGSAELGLPGGGHLVVAVDRGPDGAAIRADGRISLPSDLPDALARSLPLPAASGSLQIHATGRVAGPGRSTLTAELSTRDLLVAGPRIGPVPVGPLALRASGSLSWDGPARRISLDDGRIALGEAGEVAAKVAGQVTLRGEPRFSISVGAEAVPWQALVEALPPELGPPPTAPPVSGALSATAAVSGPLARRGEWEVEVDLDLDDLRRASRAAGPTWLSSGFEWKPIDPAPGEPPRRILVGPGNPAFVPYAEIPPALVRAVTASEDAGFFGHRGFDWKEIANAVSERGRVRGASTISQQLAKNLFLSPERTLSRKVREALGTIALEANLPKARLLEIYLNLAEWGPGVYGIGEAAHAWFGKDARQLSPREAAFLATVIPSPRRFHARFQRSGITPWWNARIDDVLHKMRVQGQLTDDQLAAALSERLAPTASGRAPGYGDAGAPPAADAVREDDDDGAAPAGDPPSPGTTGYLSR